MNNVVKGLLVTGLALAVLTGCGANNEAAENNNQVSNETANEEAANQATDATNTGTAEQPAEQAAEQPIANAGEFVEALSANGTWLVTVEENVTIGEDLVIDGQFNEEGDAAKPVARKLQLSSLDTVLSAPKITVKSENFKIEGGTVKGDIYVEANGFYLDGNAKVDGNIYFPNQDLKLTAQIYGKVVGLVQ